MNDSEIVSEATDAHVEMESAGKGLLKQLESDRKTPERERSQSSSDSSRATPPLGGPSAATGRRFNSGGWTCLQPQVSEEYHNGVSGNDPRLSSLFVDKLKEMNIPESLIKMVESQYVRYGDWIKLHSRSHFINTKTGESTAKNFLVTEDDNLGGYIGVYRKPDGLERVAVPPIGSKCPGTFTESVFQIQDPLNGLRDEVVLYGDMVVLVDRNDKVWNCKNGTAFSEGYLVPKERGIGGEIFVCFDKTGKKQQPLVYGEPGVSIQVKESNRFRNAMFNNKLTNFKYQNSKVLGGYVTCDGSGPELNFMVHPESGPPSITYHGGKTTLSLRSKSNVNERSLSEKTVRISDEPAQTIEYDQNERIVKNKAFEVSDVSSSRENSIENGTATVNVKVQRSSYVEVARNFTNFALAYLTLSVAAPFILAYVVYYAVLYNLPLAQYIAYFLAFRSTLDEETHFRIHRCITDDTNEEFLICLPNHFAETISLGSVIFALLFCYGTGLLTPVFTASKTDLNNQDQLVQTEDKREEPENTFDERKKLRKDLSPSNSDGEGSQPTILSSDSSETQQTLPMPNGSLVDLSSSKLVHDTFTHSADETSLDKTRISITASWRLPGKDENNVPKHVAFQRFLIGEENNMKVALKRFEETCRWREEKQVDLILSKPHEMFDVIKQNYRHYLLDDSKHGYPVYIERVSQCDMKNLVRANVSMQDLLHHYVYISEFTWNNLEPDDVVNGKLNPKAKYITVVDLKGVKFGDFFGDAVTFLKNAVSISQTHYPERSYKIFVLNIPRWFNMAFKIIKPFMAENTLKKIRIFRHNYEKELLQEIDKGILPDFYGGEYSKGEYETQMERRLKYQVYISCVKNNVLQVGCDGKTDPESRFRMEKYISDFEKSERKT